MATFDADDGESLGAAGGSEPPRNPSYTLWNRAHRYTESRLEVYQGPPCRTAWVYILRNDEGLVKIGYTADAVRNRMQTLSTSERPAYLVRATELPKAVARKAERVAHRLLSPHGRRTHYGLCEWFAATPSLASRRLNEAIRDTKQRRAMLSEAFEAVTRGRQPSHTMGRGRQPRKLTDAQKDIIWREWFSVRNKSNPDAAAAASERLGFAVDQFVCWHVVKAMQIAAGNLNATGASGRPFRKAPKRATR